VQKTNSHAKINLPKLTSVPFPLFQQGWAHAHMMATGTSCNSYASWQFRK